MTDTLAPTLAATDLVLGRPAPASSHIRLADVSAVAQPRVVQIADREEWNALILGLPGYDLAQGWDWAEVQRDAGWTAHRYAVLAGSDCIAAVSVTCRQIPGLPLSVLYASRGPLVDWQDDRAWPGLLLAVRRLAERCRAVFLRVSPAVPHDDAAARAALARHGFRALPDDWTTWNAPRVVLTLGIEDDEAALHRGLRRGIRRDLAAAQRRGAQVRVARDRADLVAFHRLTAAAGREKGYPVRPLARLEAIWDAYVARGHGVLLLTEHEGVLIGGLLALRLGRRAYLHRATIARGTDGQRLHQGPLVYWELIRWAKAAGCDLVDWGGSGTSFPPSEKDDGFGVYQFKSGFGARLQYWIPYHDLVFRPTFYRLARAAESCLLPGAWKVRALLNH